MLPPVLALLLQAAPPQAADRPIRVWLGTDQPVAPGEHVQVFVRTARDGYLTVLRRTTDGRIEVLFPTAPADEAFVPRGTYEVRGSAEAGAFAALEPPGTGLVLAALSATPFRTREFVRQAAWNPAALEPSWEGADAEGALTDIVQRMLGAGYFVYDLVPYSVAPRRAVPPTPVAGAQGFETCVGCVFPSVTVVVAPPPVLVCDPFFLLCDDSFFFRPHRRLDRQPAESPATEGRVLGIPSGGRVPRGAVASRVGRAGFVIPDRPATPPATKPRQRPMPVLRGREPPQAPDARPSSAEPRRRVVRLVMPATPTRSTASVPADPPGRTRTIVAVSAAPAPGTPRTPAAGAAIAPRTRALVARPALVIPARQGPAGVSTVAQPAPSGGRIRAQSGGTTQSVVVPSTAAARARVRAVVEARKRPD